MDTTQTIPDVWTRDLELSRADLAEGRLVNGAAMRERLRASIAGMEPTPDPDKEGAEHVGAVAQSKRALVARDEECLKSS